MLPGSGAAPAITSRPAPTPSLVVELPAAFRAVGGTPLVRLGRLSRRTGLEVHAKLEGANPGGSVKDRVAVAIVGEALASGRLWPGDVVVESSSGNMAVALAHVCRGVGLRSVAVVDPGINPRTRQLLTSLGARLEVVDEPDEHGSHLAARLDRVRAIVASTPGAFWPDQYANPAVPRAHRTTMREIVAQLGAPPDVAVIATGTCGTLAGCATELREARADTSVVAIDAVGSRIFGGPPGPRHLPGHGSSRPSDLLRPGLVDEVVHVDDVAAVRGARRLLTTEGLLAGASGGAVVAALDRVARLVPPGSTTAIILPDRGDRYLDTVHDDEWVRTTLGVDPSVPGWADEGPTR